MRIIIVGVHNKKGLKPLDSSTKSGKLIDRIEMELPVNIERTNLFDVDYLPYHKEERQELSKEWFWTHLPCPDDVVVLLGGEVQKNFKHDIKNLIKIKHPASQWSHKSMDEYVNCAVEKIKKYCN
jgi:hypothetical protein